MKCEELAAIMERARATPSFGYAFTNYKSDVEALLAWTHNLERKAEILHNQLKAANLQIEGMRKVVEAVEWYFDNAPPNDEGHWEAMQKAVAEYRRKTLKPLCDCGESCHCGKVRNHYCNHKVTEKRNDPAPNQSQGGLAAWNNAGKEQSNECTCRGVLGLRPDCTLHR